MNRKRFLQICRDASLLAAPLAVAVRLSGAAPSIQVYKTATCGCCGVWVQHLKANGFQVIVQDVANTTGIQMKYGVPSALQSCHTGVVDGYAIEGHVPAAEIQRLLRERPKARGLAVPGMPMGSPGMEAEHSDAYSVMLFDAAGKSTVYRRYPAR